MEGRGDRAGLSESTPGGIGLSLPEGARYHVSLRPQRHWTDQKIQVHVFYCVLALLLCSLLRRQLHRQGIDRSIPALLEELGQIREVGILTSGRNEGEPPRMEMTLSRLTEEQRRLHEALDLGRYASP